MQREVGRTCNFEVDKTLPLINSLVHGFSWIYDENSAKK
jgi:hypothetical protein